MSPGNAQTKQIDTNNDTFSSLIHRLPPKPSPMFHNDPDGRQTRRALQERENASPNSDIKVPGKYSITQVGTSPLDMLFDVRMGVRSVRVDLCLTIA
jgi:hypothetical protein